VSNSPRTNSSNGQTITFTVHPLTTCQPRSLLERNLVWSQATRVICLALQSTITISKRLLPSNLERFLMITLLTRLRTNLLPLALITLRSQLLMQSYTQHHAVSVLRLRFVPQATSTPSTTRLLPSVIATSPPLMFQETTGDLVTLMCNSKRLIRWRWSLWELVRLQTSYQAIVNTGLVTTIARKISNLASSRLATLPIVSIGTVPSGAPRKTLTLIRLEPFIALSSINPSHSKNQSYATVTVAWICPNKSGTNLISDRFFIALKNKK